MNGDRKNEFCQLLELSGDSKSLSDLELPEIDNQRKRKVRRKTRPRTTSSRHDDDHRTHGAHIDCKNFGLWLAVTMTVMWLFIISYITSVVHSENRRLEIAIQKVSATSQNVPEALQKWHETSKNLEQNQTALNGKLREIQQVLGNFSTELKQLRDTIEKKNENSQEAQLNSLKTNVADLGSKIGDAITRITNLEEAEQRAQSEQKTLKKGVEDLQALLAQIRNNSSPTSMDNTLNNVTEQTIANIRDQLSARIDNMSLNFTGELQALKQKNTWLDKDLASNKANIDELIENSANISSHVKSVENIWVEMKANLTNLEGSAKLIGDQINLLQNATNDLKGNIGAVREECTRYDEQNTALTSEIKAIKDRLEKAEKKDVSPPTMATPTVNTSEVEKDVIPKKLIKLFDNSPTQSTQSQVSESTSRQAGPVQQPSQAPSAGSNLTNTIASPSFNKKTEPSITGGM